MRSKRGYFLDGSKCGGRINMPWMRVPPAPSYQNDSGGLMSRDAGRAALCVEICRAPVPSLREAKTSAGAATLERRNATVAPSLENEMLSLNESFRISCAVLPGAAAIS